jgi:hypothetical protein
MPKTEPVSPVVSASVTAPLLANARVAEARVTQNNNNSFFIDDFQVEIDNEKQTQTTSIIPVDKNHRKKSPIILENTKIVAE